MTTPLRELDVVAHTYNPDTWETGAGGAYPELDASLGHRQKKQVQEDSCQSVNTLLTPERTEEG